MSSNSLIIPDKSVFVQRFLTPISRVADEAIVLRVGTEQITCLAAASDNASFLVAEYALGEGSYTGNDRNLNVPNIQRLIAALKMVDQDDVEFNIETNCLTYKSQTLRFKFHLYEEGLLKEPALSLDKINNFDYHINFTITSDSLMKLVKSCVITADSNKIYITKHGDKIYAELTDHTRDNVDSFTIELASYDGEDFDVIPYGLDAIKSFSTLNSDVDVSINKDVNVAKFEICNASAKLRYIVTALQA